MSFRSYIESYLHLGEWLHVVEVNVQWWRYARALSSIAPNKLAKPVTKTPRSREQCHVNQYTFGRLWEQATLPSGAPIWLPLEFCIFVKTLFYKKTCFKSSDCSIEAIHRSSWPIRYCLEKSNWTTHNYCNPMVYAHRGLINSSQDNRRTLEAIQTRSEHHTMNLDCSLHISPVWSTLLNDLLLP